MGLTSSWLASAEWLASSIHQSSAISRKASEASMKTFNSYFSIVQWGGGAKSFGLCFIVFFGVPERFRYFFWPFFVWDFWCFLCGIFNGFFGAFFDHFLVDFLAFAAT
jgi:hypothetical protein